MAEQPQSPRVDGPAKPRPRRSKAWISGNEVSKRASISISKVADIAKANGIRVMTLPGFPHPRYNAEDVERVLAEAVSVAGQSAKAETS